MPYFLAALLGGFFAFNAFATPKKVARAVESALHKIFPEAQVRADVQGKRGRDVLRGQFRSARVEMSRFSLDVPRPLVVRVVPSAASVGRVGHLEIVLRDFQWRSFLISSAVLSMDNVLVDWKALRKNSRLDLVSAPLATPGAIPPTRGRVRLVLSQDALQAWVRQNYPDIKGATVALGGDLGIRVRGSRAFLGAELPIEVAGTLGLREGRVLGVVGATVTASGAQVAPALAAALTKNLESIYEFDPVGAWPLAVSGAQVKIQNANAAPSANPKNQSPELVLEADVSLKPARN